MRTLTILIVLATLPGTSSLYALDGEEPEDRLQKAWHLLDVSGKPEAASRVFREVWETESAPRAVRGEALLGLARCERMLGNEDSAKRLLESLRARFGDVPRVARKLPAFAAGGNGPTRFIAGIAALPDRRYLDLDNGGVFTEARPTPALRREIARTGGKLEFGTDVSPDPAFAGMVAWQSDAPWIRLVTSEGRAAWFQTLREGKDVVVRYVTRIEGSREPLPAPRAFCVGDGARIRLQIEPNPAYTHYRVERSVGPETEFESLGETREPVYLEEDPPAKRVLYRVTGITGTGDEGIPATAIGSVDQRGVFSGSIVLEGWPGPRSFDLFEGVMSGSSRDLVLTGTYGGMSGASFTDWLGGELRGEPTLDDEPSPWAGTGSWQIPPDTPFRVPLRGGGVARCRWLPQGRNDYRFEYEVNPDAARFGRRLRLTAERAAQGVRIRIEKAEDVTVAEVAVETLIGTEPTRTLAVTDNSVLDPQARAGMLLRYSATGIDRHGRRTGESEVVVNLLPPGPIVGEFSFHYQQGYSIEKQQLVPIDEADVTFRNSAGGISSVTLAAARGITNLRELRRHGPKLKSRNAILMALRGVVEGKVRLEAEAQGDSRDAWDDVFVLRTRHGGWVKLAIIERAERGGWTTRPVRIRYVYNPVEPVFGDTATTIEDRGFIIDPSKLVEPDVYSPEVEERKAKEEGVRALLRELDTRAVAKQEALEERFGRKVKVAAVVSRHRAKDLGDGAYVAATFSFRHDTRDDVELTRNEWDFVFGNGARDHGLRVRTVTDDRGGIWNLGRVSFDAVPEEGKEYPALTETRVPVLDEHLYLIHTLDSESDYWTKFMVLESERHGWIIFRWEKLRDPSAYLRLERTTERVLKGPRVLLQLRGGAGGGNPNRAFMDGTTNAYVDGIAPERLSMEGKPTIQEDILAHIEGGHVPRGMVFVVNYIRYRARADGDSNGHGEFLLRVGPYRVLHLDEDRRSDGCVFKKIGAEDVHLGPAKFPVTGSLFCRVQIRPADEKHVFAEIANSSYAEVMLDGEYVQEDKLPRDPDLPSNPAIAWFAAILDHPADAARAEAKQKLVAIGPEALPYLKELAAHPTSARQLAALQEALRELREK